MKRETTPAEQLEEAASDGYVDQQREQRVPQCAGVNHGLTAVASMGGIGTQCGRTREQVPRHSLRDQPCADQWRKRLRQIQKRTTYSMKTNSQENAARSTF